MTYGWIVALDALVWAGWSVTVGYAAHRLPLRRLGRDGPLTRLRPWERGGRVYERLAIRRWKDRLPELGDVFRGGVSKRSLPARGTGGLARLEAERRGSSPRPTRGDLAWKHQLHSSADRQRSTVTRVGVTYPLESFAAETRRAELVHWAIPLVVPVFALWNPPWLAGVMAAYALVANLPCLIVQRYNRGRLERILARRALPVRQHRRVAPAPGHVAVAT
ncbi:MAG TPA: hypothetical protein VFI47_17060 [Acidimicrobiales bacterium]|nr:hypothetical protein [Acidimicrobiales bacterium]